MSSFAKQFLSEIPDIDDAIVSVEQLISQYPLLTVDEPMLWVMYMKINGNNLPEEEVKIVEEILVKLQRNITIMNNKNLEKFEVVKTEK